MIYLSGAIRPQLLGLRPDLGVMHTPNIGNKADLSSTPWAADSGCYSPTGSGAFSLSRYLLWLGSRKDKHTCLFATAPDVVGDAHGTYYRSLDVLPWIRRLGYRPAFVAQDGIENVPWDLLDCLFVGGTTEFKLSEIAYDLAAEAKARGKWAHMGRVNSWRRISAAAAAGYDSTDGTYITFGPDVNLPKVIRWLDQLKEQPCLV